MSEREFRLSEQQVGELRRAGTETTDSDTQTRFQTVRLYGTAYPLHTILDVTGCHLSTLRRWVHTYRTRGGAGLLDHRSGGNSAKLTPDQRRQVAERLQQYTPRQILGGQTQTASGQFWTVEDLQAALRRWYRVQYDSRVSYLTLLHACGFTYQRTEKVLSPSARPRLPLSKNRLKKLMDVAQEAAPTVILTEDESSLYLQATTQQAWMPHGQTPTVRVDPSRQKTNFYGTLNLETGEDLVLRADHLNSATTALYLNCVLDTYPDVRILFFWDRAPWHRGAAVEQVLQANPRLGVIWYPIASPELNPQEHVWKAMRRHVSHNHDPAMLDALADQFETYVSATRFASSFLDQYGYRTVRAMFT